MYTYTLPVVEHRLGLILVCGMELEGVLHGHTGAVYHLNRTEAMECIEMSSAGGATKKAVQGRQEHCQQCITLTVYTYLYSFSY